MNWHHLRQLCIAGGVEGTMDACGHSDEVLKKKQVGDHHVNRTLRNNISVTVGTCYRYVASTVFVARPRSRPPEAPREKRNLKIQRGFLP
jgi:hypothetical protein